MSSVATVVILLRGGCGGDDDASSSTIGGPGKHKAAKHAADGGRSSGGNEGPFASANACPLFPARQAQVAGGFLTNVPECLCSPPRVPLRVFEPQLLRQVEERIAAHAGRTVG